MDWKEEYSVGIPEIDAQHQTLAGCIALVETAVTTHQRWLAVHSALVRLADFVRIHFAVEESLLRIHRYPELERHVREHLAFADQVRQLQEKSLSVDVSEEMVAFIEEWLHEHIMTSDKHYAAYLPTAGVVAAGSNRR
jgi:hemerythrin